MTFAAIRQFLSRVALALAGFVAVHSTGAAVEGASTPTANAITIYTNDTAAMRPGGAADALLAKARQQGEIRVIVGLRTVMRMEHTLQEPLQIDAQRQALHRLQDSVLDRAGIALSAPSIDRFTFIPYMSAWVNASQLARLLHDLQVVSIKEDIPVPPALEDSTKIIHATDVWAKGVNGTDYAVAVLDTGAQTTHEMLAGKVVSQACYSTTQNGYQAFCASGPTGSGANCPIAVKGCTHGTHVSGIAVGNSPTLDGVARDANLISIQVFSEKLSSRKAVSFDTDQIKALQRVYGLRNKYKIAAVNMSLGGGQFDAACDADNGALKMAIDNLRAVGIPTVIASGNDGFTGSISSPACISTAIAVGNSTKSDLVWKNSNHSSLVKLLAPGTKITSSVPTAKKYEPMTGTSQAAPHVAGAFALLRDAKPKATIDDILGALSCTGKVISHRLDDDFGSVLVSPAKPRIDVLGAYYHLLNKASAARTWNFSDAKQALDWAPLRGEWTVTGGSYVQTPIVADDWAMSAVDNCDSSLEVMATMTRVDPSPYSKTNGFHYNAGIMLKTVVDYDTQERAGYFFAYNACRANKSSSLCTDDPKDPIGQGEIFRLQSTQSGTLLCYKQVPVNRNAPNTLKVTSAGSSYSFYVNGKLVCSVTDATYTVGPAMVVTYVPNVAGHSFSVDQVTITSMKTASPEPPALMDPQALVKVAPPGMTPQGSRPISSSVARVH